jgi:hypothetical protein
LAWRDDATLEENEAVERKCRSNLPTNFDGDENNPPCCVHLLRDMLIEVTQFLTLEEIDYFIYYGTLLGLKRGDGILPWTLDVDISISDEGMFFYFVLSFFFFFHFLKTWLNNLNSRLANVDIVRDLSERFS